MKFGLAIIAVDPQIKTKFDMNAGRKEFRVEGRELQPSEISKEDAAKVIEAEAVLERFLGVRIHLTQLS